MCSCATGTTSFIETPSKIRNCLGQTPPSIFGTMLFARAMLHSSVNYPEHFIRHQNYRLKIAKDSSDLFKNEASFKVIDVYHG